MCQIQHVPSIRVHNAVSCNNQCQSICIRRRVGYHLKKKIKLQKKNFPFMARKKKKGKKVLIWKYLRNARQHGALSTKTRGLNDQDQHRPSGQLSSVCWKCRGLRNKLKFTADIHPQKKSIYWASSGSFV